MQHNRECGLCCGSVLTLIKEPEVAANLGKTRLDEAVDAGAQKVLALCPCCEFQLRVSAEKKQLPVEVVDLAHFTAEALGFTYLDSGAMYRCVALAALERGVDVDDEEALAKLARSLNIELCGSVSMDAHDVSEAIRAPEVSAAASRVSVHPGVREAMVERQRELIESGDYVAEGRDIGTVVSPDSPLKIFLTASDEERARRRAAETGEDFESVLDAQRRRDARDSEREHGAMRAAADAVELDTTGFSLEQVVARVVALARERGLA